MGRGRDDSIHGEPMEQIQLPENCDGPGVYALEHTPTGRHYVGSSKQMKERFRGHLNALTKNRHHSWKLQQAWGDGGFVAKVLEVVDDHDKLTEREQWWIDELRAWDEGFNCRPVAECNRDLPMSDQTKEKIRAANKSTWSDPTRRAALSKRFKGVRRGKPTEDSERRRAESGKKAWAADPTRRKRQSAAAKERWSDPEWRADVTSKISKGLTDPEAYRRRCEQLAVAIKSPRWIEGNKRTAEKLRGRTRAIDDLAHEAVALYAEGFSVRQIAQMKGTDHRGISRRLKLLGVRVERFRHKAA